ncbi:hypothetical protein [Pseudoalteromonas umbrosa]|uniref:hypothetical protein n=1 Tax=Pseudoalteromonas umbrosa TaxID=3048489 RepID=UPI0024C26FAD|nr:hypothetical protein [Pseudoalteromonas sp. B95]MDK1286853.1 hypothetical protein [Pseudoalteromonas sp. B95]
MLANKDNMVLEEKLSSAEITKEQKIADKRLYAVGDITASGDEIEGIYSSSTFFILYVGGGGSLSWEIEQVPSWAKDSISECRRLRGLAESYLSRRHLPRVNRLLSDALATSLQSPEGTDTSGFFSEANDYIDKYKDEIKSTIAHGPDFVIYRTKSDSVQWFHKKLPDFLNKAVEEFESLQSLSNSVLPKSYRPAVSSMLGSSLSVAFRKSKEDDVPSVFHSAKKFILSQTDSYLRIKLFIVSLLSTIIFLLFLLVLSIPFDVNNVYLFGAGSGVLGAMVSALQRNNKISIDPYGSLLGLYSESISRLLIGIIFGLFVVICAKSELALAPFKENIYAIICFSFIAGFTERFVPDLMSSVSKTTNV